MKKLFLLSALCAVATLLPAQKKMYVWQGRFADEYVIVNVDSITFADALPEPEPLPECLEGVFSVADGKTVKFSRGNLQYTQSTGTWALAEQQYYFLGTDNVTGGTVSSYTYGYNTNGDALADKIDLFGWSGDTAIVQWGASSSWNFSDYCGDFKDWGQNIGDGSTWRTLTYDEWDYLLNTRSNASNLQGVAKIDLGDGNCANGLILLPDNWQSPGSVSFKSGCSTASNAAAYGEYQTFSLAQWQKLENAGAVFLPASGSREDADVYRVGGSGYYWTATTDDTNYNAWNLYFSSNGTGVRKVLRFYGYSVRLVQDVE